MKHFQLLLAASGLLASMAWSQSTQNFASAKQFVERLGRRWEARSSQTVGSGLWLVTGPDYDITVRIPSSSVVAWTENRTERNPIPGVNASQQQFQSPVVSSEADGWRVAERWAETAGASLPPRDSSSSRKQSGVVFSYVFRFKDAVANGYPVVAGKVVTITVNALSGYVTSFSQEPDIVYDRPNVVISEAEAKQIAQNRFRQLYSADLDQVLCEKAAYYLPSSDEFAEIPVQPGAAPRHARLGYYITATIDADNRQNQVSLIIDTETGKVLGGGVAKGGGSDGNARPESGRSMPAKGLDRAAGSYVVPSVIALLIAGLSLLWFLRVRH